MTLTLQRLAAGICGLALSLASSISLAAAPPPPNYAVVEISQARMADARTAFSMTKSVGCHCRDEVSGNFQ